MKEKILFFVIVVAVISAVIGTILFFPFMEARTFNKFSTDKKATIVDAIFAELRVEGCR